MNRPLRVLILGGGYVAITFTRGLRKAIRRGQLDVTVVTGENYQVFHGFVAEMLTGRISPGQILSPVRRIFPPSRIHVGQIESIDLQGRKVVTSRQLDGRRYELEYDHVVLALGSTDNLAAYPGLEEHAFRLKTYDACFRLKNHILTMFELADIEADPEERRRLLTFFVAGGGFAGCEVAGELADYVRRLTRREYPGIRTDECRVVLVNPLPSILPELHSPRPGATDGEVHPRLVRYATRHLERLGVEFKANTLVTWVTPGELGLSNGERIPTRTIVSAVGTKGPPIFETMPIPKTPQGRVQVDATMRVTGYENVWAAGDCAAVPHPKGGICPPTGAFALNQGKHVARNILRVAGGREPKPFRSTGLGQVVSLGRRTAVMEIKGVELRGVLGWLLWRGFLWYYIPTWDRRLRLLADWLIWPVVGRDVVEMSVADADDYEIAHHVFQPDEIILEGGEVGRYVYLITEGEVEMLRSTGEGDHVTATFGPGGHFGHTLRDRRIRETARAKTIVRAVSVRADQVNRLQRVLAPLEDLVSGAGGE